MLVPQKLTNTHKNSQTHLFMMEIVDDIFDIIVVRIDLWH